MKRIIDAWNVDLEDKRETYRFITEKTKKIVEQSGKDIQVSAWVMFSDIDADEEKTVLIIKSEDEYYGTISRTFIDAFNDCRSVIGDDLGGSIRVRKGASKNGREFVECTL